MTQPARRFRVLIVDDEAAIREAVAATLGGDPRLEISQADTGAAALALIQQAPPNLIVLDNMLPDMHGSDLCRLIKADPACAAVKVIMCTAMDSRSAVGKADTSLADDFISKPFRPPVLRAKVHRALGL